MVDLTGREPDPGELLECPYCTGEDCWPCWLAGTLSTCDHDVTDRHGDRSCTWPDEELC